MRWLWENLIGPITGIAMLFVFFIFYVHILAILDPILTILIGGPVILFLLVILWYFLVGMKDFILSMFPKYRNKSGL